MPALLLPVISGDGGEESAYDDRMSLEHLCATCRAARAHARRASDHSCEPAAASSALRLPSGSVAHVIFKGGCAYFGVKGDCTRVRQIKVLTSRADPLCFFFCAATLPHPEPPTNPIKQDTMMLEENNSIIYQSSNTAATFSKVSASGRVTRVLACSCCSVYADWPPPWV